MGAPAWRRSLSVGNVPEAFGPSRLPCPSATWPSRVSPPASRTLHNCIEHSKRLLSGPDKTGTGPLNSQVLSPFCQNLLAVFLMTLRRANLLGHDQAALDLFALGVHVDPAGDFLVLRVVAHYVDVEDEAGFRFSLEPVDVVLVVRDRRALAGLEQAVDGWPDQVMVLVVGNAIVVLALEVAPQDDEAGTHVVVAVRHNRPALAQGEDLFAEDQLFRQPLDLAQIDAEVSRSPGRVFEVL